MWIEFQINWGNKSEVIAQQHTFCYITATWLLADASLCVYGRRRSLKDQEGPDADTAGMPLPPTSLVHPVTISDAWNALKICDASKSINPLVMISFCCIARSNRSTLEWFFSCSFWRNSPHESNYIKQLVRCPQHCFYKEKNLKICLSTYWTC